MIKRKVHDNSKKWNDSGRGHKSIGREITYERCRLCDFSESNPDSLYSEALGFKKPSKRSKNLVFIDPKTKDPICMRCWNASQDSNNNMNMFDHLNKDHENYNEIVELLNDDEILAGEE